MKFYSGLMPAIRRAFGLALLPIVLSQPCLAQSGSVIPIDDPPPAIRSVQILPQDPAPVGQATTMRIDFDLANSNLTAISTTGPIFQTPNDILLQIFVEFPGTVQPAVTPITIDQLLGDLAQGNYDYTVQLFELFTDNSLPALALPIEIDIPVVSSAPSDTILGEDSFSGSFVVGSAGPDVPEPASFATFILAGCLALTRKRRAV
ncbi:MAG: hypothetical protein AAGC44_03700 [Planctomycetota bacterium]